MSYQLIIERGAIQQSLLLLLGNASEIITSVCICIIFNWLCHGVSRKPPETSGIGRNAKTTRGAVRNTVSLNGKFVSQIVLRLQSMHTYILLYNTPLHIVYNVHYIAQFDDWSISARNNNPVQIISCKCFPWMYSLHIYICIHVYIFII
jgi:hypothetical protein